MHHPAPGTRKSPRSLVYMCVVSLFVAVALATVCMISKLWPICFLIEKLMSPAVCLQALLVILCVPARDEKQDNNFGLVCFHFWVYPGTDTNLCTSFHCIFKYFILLPSVFCQLDC